MLGSPATTMAMYAASCDYIAICNAHTRNNIRGTVTSRTVWFTPYVRPRINRLSALFLGLGLTNAR